jgi:hypothetical protein
MKDSSNSIFSSTSTTTQTNSPSTPAKLVVSKVEGLTASVSQTGRHFVTTQKSGQLTVRFIPQKSDTLPRKNSTE